LKGKELAQVEKVCPEEGMGVDKKTLDWWGVKRDLGNTVEQCYPRQRKRWRQAILPSKQRFFLWENAYAKERVCFKLERTRGNALLADLSLCIYKVVNPCCEEKKTLVPRVN